MAYILDKLTQSFASSTSMQISDLPTHEAGTRLMIIMDCRTGNTTPSAPGWTYESAWSAGPVGSSKLMMLWKDAASDAEDPPLLTLTSANSMSCVIIAVNDHDGFDVIDKAGSAALDYEAFPAGTTTVDETLILYAQAQNTSTTNATITDESVEFVGYLSSSAASIMVVAQVQMTAGLMSPPSVAHQVATSGQFGYVAIKNSTGGALQIRKKSYPARYIPFTGLPLTHSLNTGLATLDSMSSVAATFGANNTYTSAPSDSFGGGIIRNFGCAVALVWGGGVLRLATPISLTGKIFSVSWAISSIGSGYSASQPICCVFADSTGNYVVLPMITKGQARAAVYFGFRFLAGAVTPLHESASPIDWSDIVAFGLTHLRSNSTANVNLSFYQPAIYDPANPIQVVGGAANWPIEGSQLKIALAGWGELQTLCDFAGVGQFIYPVPIQIGNHSEPVYFDTRAASYEQPRQQLLPAKRYGYVVPADTNGITIDACAACTIIMSQGIFASGQTAKFAIKSTSSVSAIYDFSGSVFKNLKFAFLDGMTIDACTFADCGEIDGAGAIFDGVTFDDADVAAGEGSLKLTDGGKALGCTFAVANAGDHAVRIAEAGAYELSSSAYGISTTPINVDVASGTVTITIAADDVQPAHITAGATVVWDQAVATITYINSVWEAGTIVMLVNKATDSILDYAVLVTTGYSIELFPGVDYTVGDEIEVRAGRKDGTTYYQEYTNSFVTTSEGGTISSISQLQVCPICTAFVLDGDDYTTKFAIDLTDNEVDVISTADFALAETMVWWKTVILEEANMLQLWGAMSVIEDGSFRNNTSIISMYWDNTTSEDVVETTGRRFYRTDGIRPINDPTTGGGSVDLAWRVPVSVLTIGSGVTSQDKIDIANQTLDTVVEGTVTLKQAIRLANAVNAGKTTGQPLAPVFRDIGDTKDRVTGTVDVDGNRTAVTVDLS